MRRSRGGGAGGLNPLKNHKHIGFLSNTGSEPLKIRKLPNQHSMLDNHQPASKTPSNGPLLVVFGSSLPSSTKKSCLSCRVGPPVTKLWICECYFHLYFAGEYYAQILQCTAYSGTSISGTPNEQLLNSWYVYMGLMWVWPFQIFASSILV